MSHFPAVPYPPVFPARPRERDALPDKGPWVFAQCPHLLGAPARLPLSWGALLARRPTHSFGPTQLPFTVLVCLSCSPFAPHCRAASCPCPTIFFVPVPSAATSRKPPPPLPSPPLLLVPWASPPLHSFVPHQPVTPRGLTMQASSWCVSVEHGTCRAQCNGGALRSAGMHAGGAGVEGA